MTKPYTLKIIAVFFFALYTSSASAYGSVITPFSPTSGRAGEQGVKTRGTDLNRPVYDISRHAPPITQISASLCGTVLTDLDGEIYADQLPTATAYRFRITLGSNVQIVESSDNTMRLKDIVSYTYNTTYSIDVSANLGRGWTPYGPVCNVTTAAPVTQVSAYLCGTVLTDQEGEINADNVPTATAYRFRVTQGSHVQTVESTDGTMRLKDVSFYAYNTTYSIEVGAKVNGTWIAYGPACNVTTAAPVTQLGVDICGAVLTSIEGDIYSDNVPTATAYRFRITQGSHVQTVESADGTMRLKDISFYAYNTTYSIEVGAKVNGTWIAYGPACNVTTATPVTQLAVDICGAVLTSIEGEIYSDGVPTATAYRFRITQGSHVQTVESADGTMRLKDISFYAYNTTYSIEVGAKVNGTWIAYGPVCNVTTAAPVTQLGVDICGAVLTDQDGEIYSDNIPTATAYRFRIIRGSDVQTLESTESSVRLKDISFYAYNTTYSIDVSAKVSGTWIAYGPVCNVTTAAPVTNADLSALTLSAGTLDPVFDPGTLAYTVSVSNAISSITLSPTVSDATATVKVNGTPVANGSASESIALNVGTNSITTVVTAQDGTTTKSYHITVIRDKTAQIITFNALPTKDYGDLDFAPGATSNNTGIPVTYSSSNTAVATIVDDEIHIISAGTSIITASQAGDATHIAAANVQQTLTINKRAITVTADAQNKTYGDADPAFTYKITAGTLAGQDAFIGTLTRDAGENAGSYTIKQGTLALNNNYTFIYINANLTISSAALTITANNQSKAYGAANPPLTISYSGFVNGDTEAVLSSPATVSTAATTITPTGSYVITVSGAASNNYSFNYINGTLNIIPLTNATLTNLTISSGILSPAYSNSTFAYTAAVPYDVDNLVLTPTYDATATAMINGIPVPNGSPAYGVVLNAGNNTIATTVTAQDGITKNTYTITVYRAVPSNTIVPTNILTPNGDGKNDTWIIKDIQLYPDNMVTVYDQAGRSVYSKKGYTNDWGGTLKGAPLTQGTYYYIIYFGRGIPILKGFITILKSS